MSSKGDLMENIAIAVTVASIDSTTLRDNTRCPKRWAKGRVRSRLYDPMAATILAIICSAGASAPMRPVCEHRLMRIKINPKIHSDIPKERTRQV
jgi:hypothetical protein